MLTIQAFSGSPDPMFAPRVRRLSIDAGEDGLMSTVLPQDLVVSILADRLLVRTQPFLSWSSNNSVFQNMSTVVNM